MDIKDELKKAQLSKDWSSIKRIYDKINDLCKEEADMNVIEFLKYRDNTSELCRYYSVGPYKSKLDLFDKLKKKPYTKETDVAIGTDDFTFDMPL